jgi:hypothetical protein
MASEPRQRTCLPNQATRRDIERVLTEQIKAVYEGTWETLGKTGFSLRPIRFDRAIAKGPP